MVGEYVHGLIINGHHVVDLASQFIDHKINLPSEYLHEGENLVVVTYENKYARDGSGLHLNVDSDGVRVI